MKLTNKDEVTGFMSTDFTCVPTPKSYDLDLYSSKTQRIQCKYLCFLDCPVTTVISSHFQALCANLFILHLLYELLL